MRGTGVCAHARVLTSHSHQHLTSQQLTVITLTLPMDWLFQLQQPITHPVELNTLIQQDREKIFDKHSPQSTSLRTAVVLARNKIKGLLGFLLISVSLLG